MTETGGRRRKGTAVIAVLLCALVASLSVAVAVAPAAAEAPALPTYDGDLTFPEIMGPTDPEEFSWQVRLSPEQTLHQTSPTAAEVDWESGLKAFVIRATEAHDANGAAVPTEFSVSAGDVLILTVRHREGNPAAGWAPFVYPVLDGPGWEGGYRTIPVQIQGPLDETELADQREREAAAANASATTHSPPAPTCMVPSLRGLSLRAAKVRLRAADCALGKVLPPFGTPAAKGKIVKQFRPPGTQLAAGAPVAIRLGASAPSSR